MDVKDNGFHDAENDVDQELDDAERILSGKMSESSACTGSDIYDCKVGMICTPVLIFSTFCILYSLW